MLFFKCFKDANCQYRWRLVAKNGKVVADSSEGYHNKKDCLAAIELVRQSVAAPIRTKAKRK